VIGLDKSWPGSDRAGNNFCFHVPAFDTHSMKHLNSKIFGIRICMFMVHIWMRWKFTGCIQMSNIPI